jgi:hypothetical protein
MAILFICIAVCPRCLERYLVLFCRNREGQLGQTVSNYRATGSNIRTCYPRIDSRIPPRHRQRSCRPQLEESTESNTHFIRRPPGVRKYKNESRETLAKQIDSVRMIDIVRKYKICRGNTEKQFQLSVDKKRNIKRPGYRAHGMEGVSEQRSEVVQENKRG